MLPGSGRPNINADIVQEAHEGLLDLSAEDENAVNNLMRFCYGKIRGGIFQEVLRDPVELASLYVLALQLDVKLCVALAGYCFTYHISSFDGDNDDFAKLVSIVYQAGADDRTLLDPLIEQVVDGRTEGSDWEDCRGWIEATVAGTPAFAVDLLIAREERDRGANSP